ncbi:tRNA pseudouridine(38-40) synthase TruA [Candidatus Omnitrophota bacterium]
MRNIKITIQYQGTQYNGWQTQRKSPKIKTIQSVIEKALFRITHEKVSLIGSGRTDSGAHALGQVANFKTNSPMSLGYLMRALNAILPEDIAIRRIQEVDLDFHARFDAQSKIYRYCVLNGLEKSVFNRDYYYKCLYTLDLDLMRKEAQALIGKRDFKSFQAADKKEHSSVRSIKILTIAKKGNFINFDIEAEGFLYKMVRNIVGTLLDIGRGRLEKGSMKRILNRKNRKFAGSTVPAKGLTLLKVKY